MDVARLPHLAAAIILAAGLFAAQPARAACCYCSSIDVTVYTFAGGGSSCSFEGSTCECTQGESAVTCQENCLRGVNLGDLNCSQGGWGSGSARTKWTCSGDTQCAKSCGYGPTISVCADGTHTYVQEGGSCPAADPCSPNRCRFGQACTASGGTASCACPGTSHRHQGANSCHAPTIGHSCPAGQHKTTHSTSGCHANHVCIGDQTGGGAADCRDPVCQGDQTLSAGKVCVDPACVDGTVSAGVCSCPTGASLAGGECKCGDDSRPPCAPPDPCTPNPCRFGQSCTASGGTASCACPGTSHRHQGANSCHAPTIGHSCPAGQHKTTHSTSGCHANHVCIGDQTGGGAADCRDPVCQGDQTLSAGKVCVDPACVDGTVSAGVCSCPTGASLAGGECKCGDDSRPPCAPPDPCTPNPCRFGQSCTASGGTASCACPGSEHRHSGTSCHSTATAHSCPGGQHKVTHSTLGCHANHVCIGDQTGGGAADCRDPVCQGDQTLSAGKVCVDPACVDGTVSAGVCSCPTGASLAGGECKCGDDSRPPCAPPDPCTPNPCRFGEACRVSAGQAVCACPGSEHRHSGTSCHSTATAHSCPGGQHKGAAHATSACHADHVCIGHQTGGGAADCRDPVCQGDQTLTAGVCRDPVCQGDQTLTAGVCVDPACVDGTVSAGVCSCPAGRSLIGGECVQMCPDGTDHRHTGAPDCHAAGTVHDYTCPAGRHLDGHSLSTCHGDHFCLPGRHLDGHDDCHANHVCIGDQTGGGAADCVDPACVGDQTLSAVKVCQDPICVDGSVSAGKCRCPMGATVVSGGECKCSNLSRPPCQACPGQVVIFSGQCRAACGTGSTAVLGVCECDDGLHHHLLESCHGHSCPPGRVSSGSVLGHGCVPCAAGTRPAASGTACEPCPTGTAGTGGACAACTGDQVPNEGRTACVAPTCAGGAVVQGRCVCHDTARVVVSGVCRCAAGSHEVARECVACPADGVSVAGAACTRCGPDLVPDAAATVCVACPAGQRESDAQGVCEPICPTGQHEEGAGCHAAHVCTGDQTGGGTADCRDPVCVGDQTVSAGKVCQDPICFDGSVAGGVCSCPTGATLAGGECKCGDGSRPPCVAAPPPTCTGGAIVQGTCVCHDTARVVVSGVCRCAAGSHEVARECVECPADGVSAEAGAACTRCGPQLVPDATATSCVACPAGQRESDAQGVCECTSADMVVSTVDPTQCLLCIQGTRAVRGECVCPDRGDDSQHRHEGGWCHPETDAHACPARCPGRTTCAPSGQCVCPPGWLDVLGRHRCLRAKCQSPDEAGTYPRCVQCPPGEVADAPRTACVACPPGQVELPASPGACTACAAGQAPSSATECEPCGPDTRARTGDAACTACGAGQVANAARTACEPCPRGAAETTPGACEACGDGRTPAASRVACSECPLDHAGTGGECVECTAGRVANAGGTACVDCPDGQRERSAGECEACPDGETPAADGTTCGDCATDTAGTGGQCGRCGDGEVPDGARTACRVCPPGNAELPASPGVCTACDAGEVPNATDTACVACPDGQSPDAVDLDACGDCGTDTAGTGGQCGRCGDGEVPTADRTACVDCAENEAETTPGKCEACPVGSCSDTTQTVHGVCIDGGGTWTVAQAPDLARTSCLPPGVLDLLSPELALQYLKIISDNVARVVTVIQAADEVFDVLDSAANEELDRITGKLGSLQALLGTGNALLGRVADAFPGGGSCSTATHATRTACEAAGATWTRGRLPVADAEVARILGDVEDLLAGTGADFGLTELHGAVTELRDGLDGCVAGGATTCTDTDLGDIDDAIEALQSSTLSWGTDSDITRAGTTGSHWFVRARAADNACRCWGVAINYCGEARAGPFVRRYVYDGRTFDTAGSVLIRNSRCHSIECTDLAASAVRAATGCTSEDVDWVYSDTGGGGGDTAAVETAVGDVETAIGDLETAVGDVETAVGDVETAISGTAAEQKAAGDVIADAEAGRRALIQTTAAPQRTLPRTAGGSNDVGDLTAGALSGIATWRARSVAATCPKFRIDLSGVRIAPGVEPMGVVETTAHCPDAATVNLIRALFGFVWLIATVRIVLSS